MFWSNRTFSAGLVVLVILLMPTSTFAAENQKDNQTEHVYSRNEGSIFTVEVHTGNKETKSTLGSGYLISNDGNIVTNFHVVDAYVEEPERYFLRVKNKNGVYPAELQQIDVVNDLALLKADIPNAKPLKISTQIPPQGSAIVALGNPMGFHLSIIGGIFNGFAEKGLIDRMLLSMPLNSGMSGGPILNNKDEIIGTNVSIIWLSNSLSFGVPASKIAHLTVATPLKKDKIAYRQEIHRQLLEIEKTTHQHLVDGLKTRATNDNILVGSSQLNRPPDLFDCWDTTRSYNEHGISKSTYSCNLQFTPSLGGSREFASVELLVEHLATRGNSYGFYGYLTDHGNAHHMIEERNADAGDIKNTAPNCAVDRVATKTLTWKINTCVNAYVDFPELYDFAMVATTINKPKEAIYLALHMRGFRRDSFKQLAEAFLSDLRFVERP